MKLKMISKHKMAQKFREIDISRNIYMHNELWKLRDFTAPMLMKKFRQIDF